MRCVVQRVKNAQVTIAGKEKGAIQEGLLLFLAVAPEDTSTIAHKLATKIAHMRLFADEGGNMNVSLLDKGYACLVISQFTLFADCRKGHRPYFGGAAEPEHAENLYNQFITSLADHCPVQTGLFSAMMDVSSTNDGPVTLSLDTREWGWKP